MEILVGYSGFVGSNLSYQHDFSGYFNSKNIEDAFGTQPDLCVYAGVKAEKYIAIQNPDADMETIKVAIQNIEKINPVRLVLISTIDVYPQPYDVDENSEIQIGGGNVYGQNRRLLEKWIQHNVRDFLIVRLPALFGRNLKKNFLYDLINPVPIMLKAEKYQELAMCNLIIKESYILQDNGFYRCIVHGAKKEVLKNCFEEIGFTALNFTDSRDSYQFYNLAYLWQHIQIAMEQNLKLINLAVEPLSVSEIYQKVRNSTFLNKINPHISRYDVKTINDSFFGGKDGYLFTRDRVMSEIISFISDEDQKRA